jgi:transcriptional regulator NrdR family protein
MIKCPDCGKPARVTDSRDAEYGRRRRMTCPNGHRYTTIEMLSVRDTVTTVHVANDGSVVVAKDGMEAMRNRAVKAVIEAIR